MSDEWASVALAGVVHDVESSMDSTIVTLWAAGLASGKWKQGYDRFKGNDDTFTALGVLCDIATKVGVCVWDRVDDEWFIAPLDPPMTSVLPNSVREWAKITGTHPSQELPIVWKGQRHPLWRVSDIFKVSFPDLSVLITQQYGSKES